VSPIPPVEFEYPWALAAGEHEGSHLLIRFRQFPEDFARAQFPERINIFWRMYEPELNGLPTNQESQRLETFENRLVSAVERDGHSILSVVLTCAGRREFVFHTADVAEFVQRLTNMPQEVERYPIDLLRNNDPDWAYFDAVTPQVGPAGT